MFSRRIFSVLEANAVGEVDVLGPCVEPFLPSVDPFSHWDGCRIHDMNQIEVFLAELKGKAQSKNSHALKPFGLLIGAQDSVGAI